MKKTLNSNVEKKSMSTLMRVVFKYLTVDKVIILFNSMFSDLTLVKKWRKDH